MIGIPIELDKLRHLRYTRRAMVAAEDHMKIGFARMVLNPGVKFTWVMLSAGLLPEDPDMTLEKAGDLMDQYIDAGKPLIEMDKKIVEGLKAAGWLADDNPEPNAGGT